jgi:hypothetical protein
VKCLDQLAAFYTSFVNRVFNQGARQCVH